MKWLKRINPLQKEEEEEEEEENPIIYLSPEALKHVYVMPISEFEEFQNSSHFESGGRLMEISRQYSYTVRKVADLREETVTFWNRKKGVHSYKRPAIVEVGDVIPEKLDCNVG